MSRYYYAGGRRVDLETDDELVAVDEKAADLAGVQVETGSEQVRRLPGGVIVSPRSGFSDARLDTLARAGALRPVYRHAATVLVALPEIRVEFDSAKQRKAVKDAIPSAPYDVVVSDESTRGLVLRPTSGSSDDTLAVANYIYERAHPAAASVRFVQFVPKRRDTNGPRALSS
jgi:hypothetical protein